MRRFLAAFLVVAAVAMPAVPGVVVVDNGVFRFLTQSLPTGNKGKPYVARLVTANADGPVVFSDTGLAAAGLSVDPASGLITGLCGNSGNYSITLQATDGVNGTITKDVTLGVNAAGGFKLAMFQNTALADGRVGEIYGETLTLLDGDGIVLTGVVFEAAELPPGIGLNGLTGVLSGTPTTAGTFYAQLTGHQDSGGVHVVTILPLTVLPPLSPAASSAFEFTTQYLNNGEVGTAYVDQWATTGGNGTVTFSSPDLGALGLSVSASGAVTGTPTTAGTFVIHLFAEDASTTISTNLSVVFAPSSASNQYWDYSGVPAAIVNQLYSRVPPILVAAVNVTSPVYSAVGLPGGLSYSATTGEISGTPTDVGEYRVTFTCVDGAVTLVLVQDFLVLPPNGGDASAITTNFWPSKHVLKTGNPGRDSWTGQAYYNADRRTGNVFDPLADEVRMEIGGHVLEVDAGLMTGTVKKFAFKSPAGEIPARSVQISPVKQTLKWSMKSDTIAEEVPATLRHATVIGGRGYRLDEVFDGKGVFKPALGFRRTAFVATKGAVTVLGAGKDSVKLSLLLSDQNLVYETAVTVLKVRILDGSTELLSKEFTLLGTGTTSTDRATGATVYKLKALKDPDPLNHLAKFSYASNSGKMTLNLSGLTLVGVPLLEAHLGIEVTVGDRVYYTAVTFFEGKPGKYTTTMPAN
jgi:hypothetical protein